MKEPDPLLHSQLRLAVKEYVDALRQYISL